MFRAVYLSQYSCQDLIVHILYNSQRACLGLLNNKHSKSYLNIKCTEIYI